MTYAFQKDIGSYVLVAEGIYPVALTTASGAVSGTDIDRTSYIDVFSSCRVALQARATLKKATQATYAWKLQQGDTTTAYTDVVDKDGVTTHTLTLGTTATTATQTNLHGISGARFDLGSKKKHIRVVCTPTIAVGSSTVTATGTVSAAIVFGGGYVTPPA